jgi:hypothetical protein
MENKTAVSVVSSTTGLTLGQIPKHRSVLISNLTTGAAGLTLSFMDTTGSPSNQFNMFVDADYWIDCICCCKRSIPNLIKNPACAGFCGVAL